MVAGFFKKSSLQNEKTSKNTEIYRKTSSVKEGKDLTFKDWKTIKAIETKSEEVNKQLNSRNANKTCYKDNRKSNGGFSVNLPGNPGIPFRYRSTTKSFNCVNSFGVREIDFRNLNNGYFNSFNVFGFSNINSFDRQSNFINYNSSIPNTNFNYQHSNNFMNGRSLRDSFFASDDIYRQRDLMQKPLPNPYKTEVKSKQLLQELGTSQKNNEKEICTNNKNNTKKVSASSGNKSSTILGGVPKIYVPNPNAFKDGKAFIPKPKLPEDNLQISKEEKKQQWKEYREAMKPFKNREFYNAKRVVQRLGKKYTKDLDEKSLFRLSNAREVMAAHKARLTAKYSDYVKDEGKSNELGEVYVLKKHLLKDCEAGKVKPKNNQNYSNFRETHRYSIIEPGRKILGGYSRFKGFVPDGILEGANKPIGQITAS